MAGYAGRTLRFLAGVGLFLLGYFGDRESANYLLMAIGGAYSLLALANVSLFAAGFGYSVAGHDLVTELDEQ